MVDTLLWLDQIEPRDQSQVGEQALHLSLLARKNYPVIPTAVIPANQFREFLGTLQALEPFFSDLPTSSLRLNVEDPQQLQAIARQMRQTIQHAKLSNELIIDLGRAIKTFPALDSGTQAVVLRPSLALKSLDTPHTPLTLSTEITSLIESQICWADAESLETALKSLWTELFRARNLVYWQRANLSLQQLQFAVLVQPIASAIASGSLQPNAADWEIIATAGLEFAIAQGEVFPDIIRITSQAIQSQKRGHQTISYVIDTGGAPLQRIRATPLQKTLSDTQLPLFAPLIQKLSTDFAKPIRIEWQLYEAPVPQLFITQIHNSNLPAESEVNSVEAIAPLVSGLAAASGHAIAPAYVLKDIESPPFNLPAGTVLVTPMILPDWLPLIKQAAAIVAEQGGMTSHGALIARELGIPAVVNAVHATQQIRSGDWILVDGTLGKVYPTVPGRAELSASPRVSHSVEKVPIATQLMVNLSQPDFIDRAISYNTDGVGLLKAELMILTVLEQQHPQRWLQQNRQLELIERLAEQIQQFVEAFAPNPVFYRSLDLRSHEFRSLRGAEGILPEPNPMLGLRGTFSYLQKPELFDIELAALKQVLSAGFSNLRLILPFVRTIEEFEFCRQRVEQMGLAPLPLWIMAEVPSVLFLLPDYVRSGVQGICIGTSDLTQLILGVDRDQGLMARTFDESHPAVLGAIAQLIQMANEFGIPCSISTPTAMKAEFLDCLIESGIKAISVGLDGVESAYWSIARAEQRLLLKKARCD